MRTHEPTVTRDIKAHFERISQLFRSGLPVRMGTVGARSRSSRRSARLARAYGDGWDRLGVDCSVTVACPCVWGRLDFYRQHHHHVRRLARAYGDGWHARPYALVACSGLPVRMGTVGPDGIRFVALPRLARAYGDGWEPLNVSSQGQVGLPVRTGTVGACARARPETRRACPCVRGRLGAAEREQPGLGRLARAYGDGWGVCSCPAVDRRGLPVRTGTVGFART